MLDGVAKTNLTVLVQKLLNRTDVIPKRLSNKVETCYAFELNELEF